MFARLGTVVYIFNSSTKRYRQENLFETKANPVKKINK